MPVTGCAVKIAICGEWGVGKTSLAKVFTGGSFTELEKRTVGVGHYAKTVEVSGKLVRMVVWDLSGEERFKFLAPVFLRGSRGVLFVYDVTSRDSFAKLAEWLEVVLRVVGDVPRVLVGNKVDLANYREVEASEARELAEKASFAAYFETSAKTGFNVEKPFLALAEAAVKLAALPISRI